MRIVVNSSCAVAGGAITHLRHVLPAFLPHLGEDEVVVVGTPDLRRRLRLPGTLPFVEVSPLRAGLPGRLDFENRTLPGLLRSLGADVLFHPGNFGSFRPGTPQVILVHNLAPFLDEVIVDESLWQRGRLRLLASLTRRSLRTATRTIFLSHWGRDLVLGGQPYDEDRMPVIPFGCEHGTASGDPKTLSRWGLSPDRFVLTVSHMYRYKKLEKLLDAWVALGDSVSDCPLVVVGAPYDAEYAARMRARARAARSPVHFTGPLEAPEIASLMAACRLFVFTSEAENLPITLLEAMAVGCPILTNRTCSMPETCGAGAAYVEPATADEYRMQLARLLADADARARLRERARERAKRFEWANTARRTLALLREAAVDRDR